MSDTVPGKDSIEDIILNHDCRGISALRPFLPSSFCEDAARFILEKSGTGHKTALITTGFFILSAKAPETDGPPGTIALARALRQLGFKVIY
ncbi:MAG: glutamate cyclase domain-containing protein, partial [Dehalococcoidales bacterium]